MGLRDFGCRFDSYFYCSRRAAIAFAQININMRETLGDRLGNDQFRGGKWPSHASLFVYFQSCFEMKRSTRDDVVRRFRLKPKPENATWNTKNCVKIFLCVIKRIWCCTLWTSSKMLHDYFLYAHGKLTLQFV